MNLIFTNYKIKEMKKYLLLFLLSSLTSLSAQNFIINGKFSKPYNENYNKAYILEALVATNNNAYSIGAFLGLADLDFNNYGYDWAASYEDTGTKYIYGFITYIYPLNQSNLDFLRPIYLSLTWAQISDHGPFPGGGYMYSGTGYVYPNSRNENLWILSSGYKIHLGKINLLLGIGYQHREYDLEFDEYGGDDGFYIDSYSIPQVENSVQIDVALQFIL